MDTPGEGSPTFKEEPFHGTIPGNVPADLNPNVGVVKGTEMFHPIHFSVHMRLDAMEQFSFVTQWPNQ